MLGYVFLLELQKEEEARQKVVRTALSIPTGIHNTPNFHRLCTFGALEVSKDLDLDLILCLLSSSNLLPDLHLGYL